MDTGALLLAPENEERKTLGGFTTTWESSFVREVGKVNSIALPMVVVSISQYMVCVVPIMMVGHLGELPVYSVSIAGSFSNVTGFNLVYQVRSLEAHKLFWRMCGKFFEVERIPHKLLHPEFVHEETGIFVLRKKKEEDEGEFSWSGS